MMSTRRTLSAGILLPAFVLFLLPAVASAQGAAATPSGITLSTNGYGQILVGWASDGGSDIKGFRVRYEATDESTFPGIADAFSDVVPAARRSVNISGLKHNTTYLFSVQARGATRALDSEFIQTAVAEDTLIAPVPEQVDDVELVEDDEMLMVSWSEGDGNGIDIVGYEVQIKPDGGTYEPHYHEGIGTTTTIGGLMNGTKYFVQVRAINTDSDNAGEYSDAVSGTPMADAGTIDDMEPLDAPMVTVGEPTHNSVMVSWMAVDGATGYNLGYRMEGDSRRNINVWQDMDMEYTITGLMPDTMYFVWVCAHDDGDDSPCSDDKSFKTLEAADGTTDDGTTDDGTTDDGTTGDDGVAEGAPEKVVLRTATRTSTTITISWEPPGSGMTRLVDYQMEVEEAGQVVFTNNITPEQVSVQSEVISDLKPATSYRIRVKAQNRVQGYGPWSEWQTVTTSAAASTPPGEQTVAGAPLQVELRQASTKKTTTTITIYWDIPGSGDSRLVDYQVSYSAFEGDPGFTNNVDVTADPPVSHTIRGLTAGTFYWIRVRAQNLQGYGPWSVYLVVDTTATPGAPPAGPAISKMAEPTVEPGDMMLMVSWAEPASQKSITHYQVDYKTASAAKWMAKAVNVTALEYTIDGLVNETPYLVRVRAVDSAGAMGEWSDSGSGTPTAMEKPEEPMPTPALPIFGALALGLGLVAAGRRRLRRRELRAGRVQQQITR